MDVLGFGSDYCIKRCFSLPLELVQSGGGGLSPYQIGGFTVVRQVENILQELFADGWNPRVIYLHPSHFHAENALLSSAFCQGPIIYSSLIPENQVFVREVGLSLDGYLERCPVELTETRAKYSEDHALRD